VVIGFALGRDNDPVDMVVMNTVDVGMEPEGVLELGGRTQHGKSVTIVIKVTDAEQLRDALDKAIKRFHAREKG
jgi:hypothetical protein